MSKNTKIALVVVALLVVGGFFVMKSKKSGDVYTQINYSDVPASQTDSEMKMAFSEFIKQGGSYKCEVNQNMGDSVSTGTVYTSGNDTKGEFSISANGQTMTSYFLAKDGYSYTWSSMAPSMGFKMKVTDDVTGGNTTGTYAWDAGAIGDYNCEAWPADGSTFAVPTNITFTEMATQ